MDKKVINTSKAPAPIGPYNQAIVSNNTLFISGQIPMNPETNELISGDIATETHQVMRNLHEILEEAGVNLLLPLPKKITFFFVIKVSKLF